MGYVAYNAPCFFCCINVVLFRHLRSIKEHKEWRFIRHMWKHLSIWCWKNGEGHISNERFNEQAKLLILFHKKINKIRTEHQCRTDLNYFRFKWYDVSLKTLSVVTFQYASRHYIFISITVITQFCWRNKSYTDIPKNLPSIALIC